MAPFGTLYAPSETHARCRKIMAVCKISGIELELPKGFIMGESNKTPEYLAKFPLGKIPGLETSSGFCLFESSVIAAYIARSGAAKDQLLGATAEEEALVQQFLSFLEMHVRPPMSTVIGWRRGFGECDLQAEEKAAGEIKRWLDYYEGRLGTRKWLVNDEVGPSLADLVTADIFNFAFMEYIDADMRKDYPSIVAWYRRIQTVPGLESMYAGDLVEKRREPPT